MSGRGLKMPFLERCADCALNIEIFIFFIMNAYFPCYEDYFPKYRNIMNVV